MKAKVIRFLDPKKEKFYLNSAARTKKALFDSVSDEDNFLYYDDVTVALARTVYECFYQLHTLKMKPHKISAEINYFLKLMRDNLPKVKRNIWRWHGEEQSEQ